jgi:dTDP-4-dehydrorhamnose reductase
VTGASGLLGSNVILAAREDHDLLAVSGSRPVRPRGTQSCQADLSRPGEASELFRQFRPEAVIHCAAWADVDACEADPEKARRLNAEMAGLVAEAARACRARLVHISTDAVFDGEGGPYSEADAPDPVNVYGRTKWEGEQAVSGTLPEAAVVRTNLYGWSPVGAGLLEWFLRKLEKGEAAPGWTDVLFSPQPAAALAHDLIHIAAASLHGVVHLFGADCVSKFEFGRRLAATFGLDPELVVPTACEAAGLPARRPGRLCLSSDRRGEMPAVVPVGLRQGLESLLRLRQAGYREALRELTAAAEA